MKKFLKILVFIFFFFILFFILVFVVVMPFWSSFYKDCNKIKEGMSRKEVQVIMNNYIKNKDYIYTSDDEGEFFFTDKESLFDDYQCNVEIKSDKVDKIWRIFD